MAMAQRLGVERDNVRLWDYFQSNKYKLLEIAGQSLEDAQIHTNQVPASALSWASVW